MISHKHRCLFVHIPKSAGKTIKSLFGVPEFGRDYHSPFNWIEDPYDHYPVSRYQDRPWFSEYFKFTVVRNPWDRVVSAFFYLNNGGSNQFDRDFREEHLACYHGDFEKFALDLPLFVNTKFFKPSVSWLYSRQRKKILMNKVFKFEHISNDIKYLAQLIGIQYDQPPFLNKTAHPCYRDCYSTRSYEIVRTVYADDIEKFSYDF